MVVEGSKDPAASDMGFYESAGTNIILKGDGNGRSGLFFESEKNGTNINDPTDYGFIQFHAYGHSGTSGENADFVIGVSNDSADHVIIQSPYNGGVKVGYKDTTSGTGLTTQTVFHDAYHPNADTLTTARTIAGTSFNGSANIDINYNNLTNKPTIPAAANNATITISAGTNLTGGGNFTTNQSSNETITINHEDVSSQGSVNNSGGTVIQDVTLNANGHVTALGSVNLDGRYFTETESDSRYWRRNETGSTADFQNWYSTTTYVYDATNGTRYYWNLLGTIASSGCRGTIEYEAKDDENYPNFVKGTIAYGGFSGGTSFSVQHDQHTQDPFGVQVRLDTSRRIWIRVPNCDWSHYFRFRVHNQSSNFSTNTSWSTGSTRYDTVTNATPPNSSSNILSGQNLRATSSSVTGTVPSYDNFNYFGRVYARDLMQVNGNLVWHAGNDGSGSGLDADLLDGQHGSYYLNYNNLTNKPTIPTNNNQLTNGAGYVTSSGNTVIGTDTDLSFSGANVLSTIALTDGVITSYTNRVLTLANLGYTGETNATADQTAAEILTAIKTVDGSGSGLDADLLDGQHGSYYYSSANPPPTYTEVDTLATVVARGNSTSGAITVGQIYTTNNGNGTNIKIGDDAWFGDTNVANTIQITGSQTATNGYLVFGSSNNTALGRAGTGALTYGGSTVWHAGNDGSGSGLDADMVDGLHASQFVRSDANDTKSGNLVLQTAGAATDTTTGLHFEVGGSYTDGRWRTRFRKQDKGGGIPLYIDTSSATANVYTETVRIGTYSGNSYEFEVFGDINATGNLYDSGNAVWHAGNDGSGSGLDADLLDGQQGSYYAPASHNHSGVYLPIGGKAADSELLDGIDSARVIYGGNATGTYNANPTVTSSPYQKSGFYDVHGTGNNAPTNTYYSYINMRHTNTGNNHGHQIAGSFYSQGDLYNRQINNNSYGSWSKIWNTTNDGSGSGLDADLLDGQHGSYYAPASHNHSGVYTPYDHFSHTGHDNYTSTTTSALLTEALGDNAFDSKLTAHKTSWSYAGNGNLTDAGRLTELAGTSWLWWTDNSTDNVQGNITGLCIAPTTGGSAGKMFVYNNQSSGYSPGWREIWTSTSDGSGSGLDADLLDGQHGSHYLNYNNLTNKPTIPTNTNYYLDGITKSGNTLTFSVNGTTNQTYAFGSNAFNSTTIPTNNNQLTNGAGYITDGNTNWNNSYGFITSSNSSITNKLPLAGGTMTGDLTIPNKIIHSGDTDTYMSFDAADQWKLYCGGYKMIQATEASTGYDYVSFGGTDNSGEILFNVNGGDGHFDGNVYAFSTTTSSDRKLKKNIQLLEGSLEKVLNLRGVSFEWKKDDKKSIGFIAQEVQEVVPDLVKNNRKEHDGELIEEHLGVDYGNVTALLVEAMKEQQQIINKLEARLKALETGEK